MPTTLALRVVVPHRRRRGQGTLVTAEAIARVMQQAIVNTLVITGARSGLGRALLHELQSSLQPKQTLVTSRQPFLPQTPLQTTTVVADLGTASGVKAVTAAMGSVMSANGSGGSHGTLWDSVLIHNAGTLDPLGDVWLDSAENETDAAQDLFREAQASSAVNTSSFIALTGAFVTMAKKSNSLGRAAEKPSLIVDISSLAATQAFPSWGVYCGNKAFRAMIMRTVALEAMKQPSRGDQLHTLSYSPGPLDTDMQREIRNNSRVDRGVRTEFQQMHDAGELVDPRVSAVALAELIKLGPSKITELDGAVDFYDLKRA